MAGAPVERGVSGSELETESMASTNSAPEWPEFEACALPAGCGTLVELTGYGLVLSAVNRSAAVMRRKLSDAHFQTPVTLSALAFGASDSSWLALPNNSGRELLQPWDS